MDMLTAFGQLFAVGIRSANYVAQRIFGSFLPEAMYFLAVLGVLLFAFAVAYIRWVRRSRVRQRTEAPPKEDHHVPMASDPISATRSLEAGRSKAGLARTKG